MPISSDRGAWRAALIFLVLSLALPPLLAGFALATASGHFSFSVLFLWPLAGAYPFLSVIALPAWLAWTLTALQMGALAVPFARYTRLFSMGEQIIAALLCIALLAVLGAVVRAVFDLEIVSTAFSWE